MRREIDGRPAEHTGTVSFMATDEMLSRLTKAVGVANKGDFLRQAVHEYLLKTETALPPPDPLEEYLKEETKESLAHSPLTEEQRMNLTVLPPEKKERKKLVVELPPLPNMEDLLG